MSTFQATVQQDGPPFERERRVVVAVIPAESYRSLDKHNNIWDFTGGAERERESG